MYIKKWVSEPTSSQEDVAYLAHILGIDPYLAALLLQKSVSTFEEAKLFFRPSLANLHDPFLMRDMQKAVDRLVLAMTQQEKVLIYGDYDVDGVTSIAFFYDFLSSYFTNLHFYVPDRYTEGYGVSQQGITWAQEAGITLIITLDCGIKALEPIQKAKAASIDVIVCDHHEPDSVLPPAYAILDPKQPSCMYPFKELSGCGVGFKFLHAFLIHQKQPLSLIYPYLDLVAISIACDLVPICGENRILAYHGLKQLNQATRVGIKALMQVAKAPNPLDVSKLVFNIGPRLNAAGRVSHASLSIQLLLERDPAQALLLAQQLELENNYRKELDQIITEEALALIAANHVANHVKTTVLFKADWHKGLVGIVASRCIEHYYRPTIILTAVGSQAIGSARSVEGYNIYQAIAACADLLDQYGGHAHAAGLKLPIANLAAFQSRFEETVARTLPIEAQQPIQKIHLEIPFSVITPRFYQIIRQMSPFGNGNRQPVFSTQPVIASSVSLVKENHLKMRLQQLGTSVSWDAIGFGLGAYLSPLRHKQPCRIAYTIEENAYFGETNLQLNVRGIQLL